MKKANNSIDGFGVRRRRPQTNMPTSDAHRTATRNNGLGSTARRRTIGTSTATPTSPVLRNQISNDDISESLKNIDAHAPKQKKLHRKLRAKGLIKWIVILVLVMAVGLGGYLAWGLVSNSSKVFKGGFFDIFQQQQKLAQDANGWTNILVLGTSDDDPLHEGNTLTDSMQIISLNQTTKKVVMYSVPRDLWVKFGQSCPSGYEGKINAYYSCVGGLAEGSTIEQNQAALQKVNTLVGDIYGINIQYGANVNALVIRDLVNAVGGKISVDVQGSGGAKGVLDSNFDWKCGQTQAIRLQNCPPRGYLIDYENGIHEMDADHALYFAQSRGDTAPTYGLGGGNFDREANQRKVALAIREKAVSAGTLSDIGKVTALMNSMGDNIRTTIALKDISALINVIKNVDVNNIQTIPNLQAAGVFTTGLINGQSSVFPAAGTYSYGDLQQFIQRKISSDPVLQESATLAVFNGSGQAGAAKVVADDLKNSAQKYNIITVMNAPGGEYVNYTVYSVGDVSKFPATSESLKKKYSIEKIISAPSNFVVDESTDFIVVVGDGAQLPAAQSAPEDPAGQ